MKAVDQNSPWLEHLSEVILKRWPDDIYLIDSMSTAPEGLDPAQCIVICNQMDNKGSLDLAVNANIRHIVQVSHPEFDREINLSAAIIHDTDSVIMDPSTYFFDVRDKEYGAPKLFERKFSSSKEKGAVVSEIQSFLASAELPQSVSNSVQLITDEVFTNAVMWGPPKRLQKSKFANLQKNKENSLPEGAFAKMIVAHDPKRLMVAAYDPFGSLDIDKIISRLAQCYDIGVSTAINLGPGRTGIGLFLSFEQAMSLTLLVNKGRGSLVAFTLPLGVSGKKRTLISKNIHLSCIEQKQQEPAWP